MNRIYDFSNYIITLERSKVFGEDCNNYHVVFGDGIRKGGYADVVFKDVLHSPLVNLSDKIDCVGYIANFYPYGNDLKDDERPRLGIGKNLIDLIKDDSKDRGCDILYLVSVSQTARDFYLKNGFDDMNGFLIFEL